MAEALGVDVRRVYSVVFTLGTVLGTTAGALVVPTAAASLDMAIEFVIEAFAVVVIGGLGSMRGALAGALIVGLIRAFSPSVLSRARGAGDLSHRDRRADLAAGRTVRENAGMKRHRGVAALMWLRPRSPCCRWPVAAPTTWLDDPVLPTPSPCSGSTCCSATPDCCRSAMPFLGHRRLRRGDPVQRDGHQILRADAAHASMLAALMALPVGAVVRALRRHLLRHADARLRHAVPLLPVQVLPPHRRRQRHARAAHDYPRPGLRRYNKIEFLAGPFYYYCLACSSSPAS